MAAPVRPAEAVPFVVSAQSATSHIFFVDNRVRTLINRINTVLDRNLRLRHLINLGGRGNIKI
jgi:hypothetical protein